MNIFLNIWSQLQNYFRDWLKDTGGIGAYTTFRINLSEAHDEKRYTFSGDQLVIAKSDSIAYIKLNDTRNENIDTTIINQINTPFNEFYITNNAATGILEILVGSEGIFNSYPARINAIITDPTDAMGNIHRIGNAELAARLGFIYSFDRRGNVKWFDDMQGSYESWRFTHSSGGSHFLTAYYPFYGDQAVALHTSNNADAWSRMFKAIDPGYRPRFGIEVLMSTMDANDGHFTMVISCTGDGKTTYGEIRLDTKNDEILLREVASGSYIKVADHDFYIHNISYLHVKVVMDSFNEKFVRVIVDGIEYDLSAYVLSTTTGSDAYRLGVTLTGGNIDNEVCEFQIGGVVYTDNEP